jgi:hypothetical protein
MCPNLPLTEISPIIVSGDFLKKSELNQNNSNSALLFFI